jgi:hypothetical protein
LRHLDLGATGVDAVLVLAVEDLHEPVPDAPPPGVQACGLGQETRQLRIDPDLGGVDLEGLEQGLLRGRVAPSEVRGHLHEDPGAHLHRAGLLRVTWGADHQNVDVRERLVCGPVHAEVPRGHGRRQGERDPEAVA